MAKEKGLESVSFFFPAYYDEKSIPLLVREAHRALAKTKREFEIIVVDDCSPDNTGWVADELSRELSNVRAIHNKRNLGYGGALTVGFSNAKKDLVGFTDGDAQFDVRDLERFLREIEEADIVIGYRINRAEGFQRKLFHDGYKLALRIILGLNLKDPDCGFKMMRTKFFDKIRPNSRSGFFSAEMLCKAKKNKLRIKQIPVKHYNRPFGSSKCFKTKEILIIFKDMLAMRFGRL